ncbi:MAG: phosphopentomutase [Proteobacteria bacterium]|nr:phosphopentomutase [Pseudomonadota bacterium]
MKPFKRVVLLVLDSVGIGEAKDAKDFGDAGSHTLRHIVEWFKSHSYNFEAPNLCRWGLSEILPQLKNPQIPAPQAAHGIMMERSPGKDTTTGHWEIAGSLIKNQFPTYPDGFPKDLLDEWAKVNNLKGYLGNKSASGTAIIDEYGVEHIQSSKPIVYTSADSVLQIACSEESFGLERLYSICQSARKFMDPLHIGRVIARPFVGSQPGSFKRTEHRKDFSIPPPPNNMLDLIVKNNKFVAGVGKIKDIFAYRSVTMSNPTGNNEKTFEGVLSFLKETKNQSGLIFANLIDFDMHYGHRRDPKGYGDCILAFDAKIPQLESALSEDDLLIITADHGNDPTYKGNDHTRENVPLFVFSKSPNFYPIHLGFLNGFGHVARLCLDALGLEKESPLLACYPETHNLLKHLTGNPS